MRRLSSRGLFLAITALSAHPVWAHPLLSIDGGSASEGGLLEYTVSLDHAADHVVTVSYRTDRGTAASPSAHPLATQGVDYAPIAGGRLTFAKGETKKTIRIRTLDDGLIESGEAVAVRLTGPNGAKFKWRNASPRCPWGGCSEASGGCGACGLIVDEDTLPGVAVFDAEGWESDRGVGFRVVLSKASASPVSVTFATADETAESGEDYTQTTSTVEFAAGEVSRVVRVPILQDEAVEPDETMVVRLFEPMGASIYGGPATGRILDDDGVPVVSLSGSTSDEGNWLKYTFSLSEPAPEGGVILLCSTENHRVRQHGSPAYRLATSGVDYEPTAETICIDHGESTYTHRVFAKVDIEVEPVEAVVLQCTGNAGARFEARRGTGECPWSGCSTYHCGACALIRDGGAPEHTLTVSDASGLESNSRMEFTLTLDKKFPRAFGLRVQTRDGTAVAGEDYQRRGYSQIWFPGDPLTTTFAAFVIDDDRDEPDETFVFQVSAPGVKMAVVNGSATGTILDDDGAPAVGVADAGGEEGSSAVFRVTLRHRSAAPATVGYATADGTAVAGEDYAATSGTLTFAPGRTLLTVPVRLLDDAVDEPGETFTLTLSAPAGATLGRAVAAGAIEDTDDPPAFSAADASGAEGGTLVFRVTASGAGAAPSTVAYATEDGTAAAGEDYAAASGTLTFAPGETEKTVPVSVFDDAVDEADETFTLTLSAPAGATLGRAVATGTVEDADDPPAFSVADASGGEGGTAAFPVTLAGRTARTATVAYATEDGTARAGSDYAAASGTLTFAPGESRRTVRVDLLDDATAEPAETFALRLSSPANARLAARSATGTVVDDDGAPQLSARGGEGREGGTLAFEVRLAGAGAETVRVSYATEDGTARAGSDYAAVSGTLTFAPGEAAKPVRVRLLEDSVHEGEERFRLALSSPANAALASGTAAGTIVDADAAPRGVLLSASPSSVAEGAGPTPVAVTATLDGSLRTVPTAVSVRVSGSGDPAAVDFETVADFGIAIAAEARRGTGTFTLSPEDDAEEEPDETLTVSGRSDLPVTPATVVLTDAGALETFRVLLFESSGNPHRQGFLRTVNHSPRAGEVYFEATDDGGVVRGPVTLTVEAGEAAHFNSDDLENGNAAKGLSGGVGAPTRGEWRLLVSSDLDIEVLAYSRTKGELGVPGVSRGFVTSVHDAAPRAGDGHAVAFFNPGRNGNQVSRLRLVNLSAVDAEAVVAGRDDAGAASGEVRVRIAADTAATLSAAELESGVGGGIVGGALGEGAGKWRLVVTSATPLAVKSLLESGGRLTNLSTVAPASADGVHRIPLFPAASDPGREGVLRVVNDAAEAVAVRIDARDDLGLAYGPATLRVAARSAAQITSRDLEAGNPAKGLDGATGPPANGAWRLALTGPAAVRVMAIARARGDGLLTSLHDAVPAVGGAHRVLFFNPAENRRQTSRLRLVNDGARDASVTVTGVDDAGVPGAGAVRLRVAAGTALEVGSAALETGSGEGVVEGALGDGAGKWRLAVTSDVPVVAMSLLESPTGHLSNLSTRLRSGE